MASELATLQDIAAHGDLNPVQRTRLQELSSQQGSSGSNNDIASLAAQQLQMYQKANEPAISSLQASIPEIQNKYAQTGEYLQKQVTNLDTRYKNLLDSIKGLQQSDVQATTTNTSQELGRRGISAEGGLFGKTINEAVLPVNRAYATQIGELGATQQSALDTLLNQISGNTQNQTAETRAVQNAIAQLQAGGNTSAITNALQLYQTQQSAQEAQANRDLQEKLAAVKTETNPLEQEKLLAEIAKLQAQTAKITSGGGSSGGDVLTELQTLLGGL
jgi:hypothetical protein